MGERVLLASIWHTIRAEKIRVSRYRDILPSVVGVTFFRRRTNVGYEAFDIFATAAQDSLVTA